MRMSGLAAALVLCGSISAAPARATETGAVTPAGVEIILWCARFPDVVCRRRAAAAARERCRDVAAKARFVRSALLRRTVTRGQEGTFIYDCVR